MALHWEPRVHLRQGAYEAWISPSAGGRLARLLWHGPAGDRDAVVPAQDAGPFEPDAWPRQGAFPMLPYTNKLRGACFHWDGRAHRVRPVPGQAHGLHGMGHRRVWRVASQDTDQVLLAWDHQADALEWPWAFSAQLTYALTRDGLQVALALTNRSDTAMPAVLGWHPYVPKEWLACQEIEAQAAAVHDLGSEGLGFPVAAAGPARAVRVDLRAPRTLALQDWASGWTLRAAAGDLWRLTSDAAHLVHHLPPGGAYACVEPVTALPGSLQAGPDGPERASIGLPPGAVLRLGCQLAILAQP